MRQASHRLGWSDDGYTFLEDWFAAHPDVWWVRSTPPSMTLRFDDGAYLVILDVLLSIAAAATEPQPQMPSLQTTAEGTGDALILNPCEYLYGSHHCTVIGRILGRQGYAVTSYANEAVDIPFLRQNLSASILYLNTHAGYWDIDGDGEADSVVVASGEHWTTATPEAYPYEYEHQLIVEGVVGPMSFVAITPGFIATFYPPGSLPDTLVYMATCSASHDASMAVPFLAAGASVYIGWSDVTVAWTNSWTSVAAFRMLSLHLPVDTVCLLVRYGGMYNRLFRSELTWFGDGSYRLP
jgi:hypothetical protein